MQILESFSFYFYFYPSQPFQMGQGKIRETTNQLGVLYRTGVSHNSMYLLHMYIPVFLNM